MKRYLLFTLLFALCQYNIAAFTGGRVREVCRNLPFEMERVSLPEIPSRTVSVEEFGGVGDGIELNTEVFATAIRYLSSLGGGHISVPQGIWLTGPIIFESNIDIHLDKGAVILFSSDKDLYPIIDIPFEGLPSRRCISQLYAKDCKNISVTGDGIIDGNGGCWRKIKKESVSPQLWKKLISGGSVLSDDGQIWYPDEGYRQKESDKRGIYDENYIKRYLRPTLLTFESCSNVFLQGCVFQNSPSWNLHPVYCKNLVVSNVIVRNPEYAANGDGIDIDSCENVLVIDSSFDCGDDGICVKSGKDEDGRLKGKPTRNLVVDGCTVFHGHGGFVVGSEMSGGVEHILVRNCSFHGTDVGLRFKSRRGRGGVVRDVWIENVQMTDVSTDAIRFNLFYFSDENQEIPIDVDDTTPEFRDIHIRNVCCNGAANAMLFRGLPEKPITNIEISNCTFKAENGIAQKNAENVKITNVKIVSPQEEKSDSLNVLLFGHSYTGDCTDHLPLLLKEAGITSVRIARFKKANCSLEERYKFFVENSNQGFSECVPGATKFVERPCSFKEAINERAWDYVIFQNSIENEGRYEMAQPYLDKMVEYVKTVSREKFGKEPEVCWNLFWPMSKLMENTNNESLAKRMSYYDHDSHKMWQSYVNATRILMSETGIAKIIPSGTAIMNLRNSYLNTSRMREFTKDGYHLSSGVGRYAAACVLFQCLIAPKFGVSILGNSLRLPDLPSPVTDENALFIQRCAFEAVENPFEVKVWPENLMDRDTNTLTRFVKEISPLKIKYVNIEAGATTPFKLLHISDSHIAKADRRDDTERQILSGRRVKLWSDHYLEEAFAYAHENKLDIIHTGDLIDFISEANLDIASGYFQMERIIGCPGNHEFAKQIGGVEETDEYKAGSFDKVQAAYPFPLAYNSEIINGVNFISLDDSYYKITEEQFDFVKNEIGRGLPVILLCHVPIYTPEFCEKEMARTSGKCSYLLGTPDEIVARFSDERAKQQKADDTTKEFIAWLKTQPLLKGILCGHCHTTFEERFSPTAVQYAVGAGFEGEVQEITFK